MRFSQTADVQPKRGRKFRVLAVCRISTDHQNEMSLEDQAAYYREWLDQWLDGEYEIETISSQGSGELLDRQELIEISDKIQSGLFDIVITEDLGRIARRLIAMQICEEAEDSKTRLIAINDQVDTFEDGWRQNAFFATMRHESYNRDTSQRIKRSHRNRFSTGEMVRQLPAGYTKPHVGATEAECSKHPSAEPIYDEWFTRLEDGQTFAQIAQWLNSIDFPTGMATRRETWNGTLVSQTTRNPILKGLREHNRRMAQRVNRTGRRKSVPAPAELLLTREAHHLAFIEPDRYDRVLRKVTSRNERFRKGIADAEGDSRNRGTRNDSRWPSQHVRCGICGRNYVLGGHGRKDRMMCDGARSYECWNAMTVDQAELARSVAAEIHRKTESLPEFDGDLVQRLEAEIEALSGRQNAELAAFQTQRAKTLNEIDNLTQAIADGLNSSSVRSRLSVAEDRLSEIEDSISAVKDSTPTAVRVPSADEVRHLAREAFLNLAVDDPEFGRVMREIISEFYVLPYRLVDGGLIMPRCVFRLNLSSIQSVELPAQLEDLSIDGLVDLTDSPQRAEFCEQVVELRASGKTEAEVADQLGITKTAAQRAARLNREMVIRGVSDPWQPVRADAEAADCYKRIAHQRYGFNPLEGFTAKFPELDTGTSDA